MVKRRQRRLPRKISKALRIRRPLGIRVVHKRRPKAKVGPLRFRRQGMEPRSKREYASDSKYVAKELHNLQDEAIRKALIAQFQTLNTPRMPLPQRKTRDEEEIEALERERRQLALNKARRKEASARINTPKLPKRKTRDEEEMEAVEREHRQLALNKARRKEANALIEKAIVPKKETATNTDTAIPTIEFPSSPTTSESQDMMYHTLKRRILNIVRAIDSNNSVRDEDRNDVHRAVDNLGGYMDRLTIPTRDRVIKLISTMGDKRLMAFIVRTDRDAAYHLKPEEDDDWVQNEIYNDFAGKEIKEHGAMYGQGSKPHKGITGMASNEIENIMKPIASFKGTYARDEINEIPISKTEPTSAIINTDPRNKPGMHWVAIYIDPKNKNFEFYNSFGEPADVDMTSRFMQLLRHNFGKVVPWQYKNNLIREQANNSSTCGVHAMRFIAEREDGVPYKEATPYFKSMEGSAQKDINKFREFGYIR